MGSHIDQDGKFQSDKYPETPPDLVPLKVTDKAAQPLLWIYAQLRRPVDAEFSADLETVLAARGYVAPGKLTKEAGALWAVQAALDHVEHRIPQAVYIGLSAALRTAAREVHVWAKTVMALREEGPSPPKGACPVCQRTDVFLRVTGEFVGKLTFHDDLEGVACRGGQEALDPVPEVGFHRRRAAKELLDPPVARADRTGRRFVPDGPGDVPSDLPLAPPLPEVAAPLRNPLTLATVATRIAAGAEAVFRSLPELGRATATGRTGDRRSRLEKVVLTVLRRFDPTPVPPPVPAGRLLKVEVQGSTDSDIELGLDEVVRLVRGTFTTGHNRNDTGSYWFELTGEEQVSDSTEPPEESPDSSQE